METMTLLWNLLILCIFLLSIAEPILVKLFNRALVYKKILLWFILNLIILFIYFKIFDTFFINFTTFNEISIFYYLVLSLIILISLVCFILLKNKIYWILDKKYSILWLNVSYVIVIIINYFFITFQIYNF